jgi:hypothetical protein
MPQPALSWRTLRISVKSFFEHNELIEAAVTDPHALQAREMTNLLSACYQMADRIPHSIADPFDVPDQFWRLIVKQRLIP